MAANSLPPSHPLQEQFVQHLVSIEVVWIIVLTHIGTILAQCLPVYHQRVLTMGRWPCTSTAITGRTSAGGYRVAGTSGAATTGTALGKTCLMALQQGHMHSPNSWMMLRRESDPSVVVQVEVIDPFRQGHEFVHILLTDSFPTKARIDYVL